MKILKVYSLMLRSLVFYVSQNTVLGNPEVLKNGKFLEWVEKEKLPKPQAGS